MRNLIGVVANNRATKGALITCANFTREATKLAAESPRIELINLKGLTELVNLHLSSLSTDKADRYYMK